VADTLIERAKEWRGLLGANSVELRHCSNSGLGNPQRGDKLTYWLSLPTDTQSLWDSFQPKVRAQIRRGEKEEPVIEFGTVELLDDFYEVFSRNMRDLGTPVYSKSFFKNLLIYLEGPSQLVIARVGGKVVGCAYIVGFGERMEIPWASTLREYNHTCINMVMYWRILEHSIAANYRLFDFGRCSQDAGTARFKKQWGATPIPLHWEYLLEHGNPLPTLNPSNPKFRLMIAVWKRLPVWVTRIIGPGIVKYLP
jgi:FemAB-related protein (PEP-CTERM system-associated)